MKIKNICGNMTALLLLTLCVEGQSIAYKDPMLRMGTLRNGLTYYIHHNANPAGRADFYIVQKVGSILEEEHQRGLAHFLEHMAFNGTKHFPGNSMIQQLEKNGIRFGSNINAYTSYDETVYKLTDVPVQRTGMVDTALLVLHDWSGSILNEDKDIDEERGVIREEWRTRSSGYLRVQENQVLPVLFAGTQYANRLPIGTLDIINHFKPQELRDYYKKWYRPDLQAIIVVGDVDASQVEAKLQQLFSKIPLPPNVPSRAYHAIPDNDQPIIAIGSDPEIFFPYTTIYWKLDTIGASQKGTRQFFKESIIQNIVANMLNQRFADIKKKNPLYDNATASMGNYSISSRPAWVVSVATPAKDSFATALKTVLLECERMRRFGFTKNEFDPGIKQFKLTINGMDYQDRSNRPNFMYTRDYVQFFLHGEVVPTPEWKYRNTQEIIENLTIDTLNFYAKKYIRDNNIAFELIYPSPSKERTPTAPEITQIWEEVKRTSLDPWVKEEKVDDRKNLKAPIPGKVVRSEKNTTPYGYHKWTLSNGVKIWFKQTATKEAKMYAYGYKPGGYSIVKDQDLPSALAYNEIKASTEGFKGFYGIASGMKLEKNNSWISTEGDVQDASQLFEYIYLQMTQLKKEKTVFANWKAKQLEQIKSRSSNPKSVYSDTLVSIMANNHPRSINLNDPNVVNRVDYEKIIRLHNDIFGNAHDFTFVITGNVREDSVKQLAEKWLGGLPSKNSSEKLVDHGMYPPKGIVKRKFSQKMETPQSTITIGYTGEIPYTRENYLLMSVTSEILGKIYLQRIREKEGGSYGVGVSGELMNNFKKGFLLQVNFDTDPDPVKKQKLIGIVYEEITKLMEQGPDKELVEKVRKNFLKDYWESRSTENARYWNGTASALLAYGIDWRTNYDKAIAAVTPQTIQAFAKSIFTQGNLIEVNMDPAPEEETAASGKNNSSDFVALTAFEVMNLSKYDRAVYDEKRARHFRDSGLVAWSRNPTDPQRYKWLTQTVRQPPAYWKDINKGARAEISGIIYSTPVGWQAIDQWEASYEEIRKEFMNAKEISDKDRETFQVEELYGMVVSGLNKERHRNGKLDVKKITGLCLEAANILAKEEVGKRGGGSNSYQLLSDMDMFLSYNTAFGWGLDELQEFLKIMSVSTVPRMQQWVREKSALLELRNTPLKLKFTSMDNQQIDLEKLRGKVVLVDFWNTGCTVCIERMGEIRPVYEQYKNKGFEVLSVSIDTPEFLKQVKAIKEKIGADWPTGLIGSKEGDKVRLDQEVFYKYGFNTVPRLLLFDKSGKMVAYNGVLISGDIEPILKKYLAE